MKRIEGSGTASIVKGKNVEAKKKQVNVKKQKHKKKHLQNGNNIIPIIFRAPFQIFAQRRVEDEAHLDSFGEIPMPPNLNVSSPRGV